MSKTDIIDVDLNPIEARRKFWRKILRFGLPYASIVLISGGLIGSALYTAAMNKTDVLALSRGYIDALNSRVLSEVGAYLHPARDAAATLASAVQENPLSTQGRAQFERMAQGLLKRHSQLAAMFLGTPGGEFLMIRRNTDGTADTKLITKSETGTVSIWSRRNSKGKITGTETNKADPYDPRTRGWYRDATKFGDVSWSQVYIFFTDKTPGITASTAVRRGDGAPIAVVGADIYLNSLSVFLERLQNQARGRLAIVDGKGQIVAFHDPQRVIVNTSKGPRPRLIRELGIPALAQAFDRLRVEGPANSITEIDGDRYLFGASSLRQAVQRDWWLLLLAPENAYLGFVAANSQRALIASSIVILLSMILAGFLTYQGMVADRSARDLRLRQEKLEAQRRTFSEIGDYSELPEPTDQQHLRRASETLARFQNARRISIWRIRRGGECLTCVDAYEADTKGHTEGAIIQADNCGEIFSDIAEGRVFEISDVETDSRAISLNLSYLQSVGTKTLLSVPIVLSDRVLGTIWIEDASLNDSETTDRSAAQVVANMLAARFQKVAELQSQASQLEGDNESGTTLESRYH